MKTLSNIASKEKKRNLLKETKVNQILDPAALSLEVVDL